MPRGYRSTAQLDGIISRMERRTEEYSELYAFELRMAMRRKKVTDIDSLSSYSIASARRRVEKELGRGGQ